MSEPAKPNPSRHSLIPACDLAAKDFAELVEETCEFEEISAYKVGFRLGLEVGLAKVVETVRQFTNKPVIYDHQKAGTDIPDTAKLFMEVCHQAGIAEVILFPVMGPKVLKAWVEAARQTKLEVMVGGIMTHAQFLVSEGGFIDDSAVARIYLEAAEAGVRRFVVPATKMDFSWSIFELLKRRGYTPTFFSPGVGAQGGEWAQLISPQGPSWHAIVGRALLQGGNYRHNAEKLIAELHQNFK